MIYYEKYNKIYIFDETYNQTIMKKTFLMLLPIVAVSCTVDDGSCGCVPPPGPDEKLIVKLKNSSGDDLLNPDVFGHIANDKLVFYLLTGNNKINLTEPYKNNNIIHEYISEKDGSVVKDILLDFGWYMKDNNGTKEGSYVIDYSGLYPNDTIYTKYKVTKWADSDTLLEVRLNGTLFQTDSVGYMAREIVIVK